MKPDQATLVPEKREEITTEGGLDIRGQRDRVARAVDRLRQAGISVSLFLDPDPRQIEEAARLAVDAVELHTGQYALAAPGAAQEKELDNLERSRRPGPSGRADAPRRPRLDLPQRPAGRRDRRDARVEHRPQHRRPRDHGRISGGGAGDEAVGG